MAILEQAASSAKPFPALEDESGFLLAVLARRKETIEHFQRALALDAEFAPAAYHLGVALWLEERRDAALLEQDRLHYVLA